MFREWNDILNKEKEKFAEMQAQMVPTREMEMLRMQMIEELELPHRQRVDTLTEVRLAAACLLCCSH